MVLSPKRLLSTSVGAVGGAARSPNWPLAKWVEKIFLNQKVLCQNCCASFTGSPRPRPPCAAAVPGHLRSLLCAGQRQHRHHIHDGEEQQQQQSVSREGGAGGGSRDWPLRLLLERGAEESGQGGVLLRIRGLAGGRTNRVMFKYFYQLLLLLLPGFLCCFSYSCCCSIIVVVAVAAVVLAAAAVPVFTTTSVTSAAAAADPFLFCCCCCSCFCYSFCCWSCLSNF